MGLADVFRTDLVPLQAPSVYDFRKRVVMHGPIADAVPSTNEFEMYPVGLTSMPPTCPQTMTTCGSSISRT
jgi:hypothetical protein